MSKNITNDIGEIATFLDEVSNPAWELPIKMQQYIFQVFRVLTNEIALLNLEQDQEQLVARYAGIRQGLLEIQGKVMELLGSVDLARRKVVEAMEQELEEMLSLLELTKEICLK